MQKSLESQIKKYTYLQYIGFIMFMTNFSFSDSPSLYVQFIFVVKNHLNMFRARIVDCCTPMCLVIKLYDEY